MRDGYQLKELKIELNRNCPLRCLHCSSNGMPGAPERLDPQKISEIIREFADLGGEKVCISGGEPLCYEELPTVVDNCRRANIETALYTTCITSNGSSLKTISDRMLALLCESKVKIIVSLHGACESTHDSLTQVRGSFKATIAAMERAVNAGALVEVHVVPTAININEIAGITKLPASMGIKKLSWLRFVPQGRGLLNREILQLRKEQLRELANKKKELQQKCQTVAIRTGSPFNILLPEVPVRCEAGLSILTIRPDGHVAPCDAFKRFRLRDDFGNILHHSLADAWHKSYFLNLVRALHECKLDSSCASCPLYSRCNSGCPAQKAIAAGAIIHGRDPDCPLSDIQVVRDEIKEVTVR